MRPTLKILSILLLALTGCVSNISHDPRYGTDYGVGQVYRVKKPLFAEIGDGTIFGNFSDPILTPIGKRQGDLPSSLEDYERDPRSWRNIAGVISPNTKLRIEKIELERNPENGRTIWIKAQILDGALAGRKHAELHFISSQQRNEQLVVDVPIVDTNILERLTAP